MPDSQPSIAPVRRGRLLLARMERGSPPQPLAGPDDLYDVRAALAADARAGLAGHLTLEEQVACEFRGIHGIRLIGMERVRQLRESGDPEALELLERIWDRTGKRLVQLIRIGATTRRERSDWLAELLLQVEAILDEELPQEQVPESAPRG